MQRYIPNHDISTENIESHLIPTKVWCNTTHERRYTNEALVANIAEIFGWKTTSLEDLGAATCKLVNFIYLIVQSPKFFRSPLGVLQKSSTVVASVTDTLTHTHRLTFGLLGPKKYFTILNLLQQYNPGAQEMKCRDSLSRQTMNKTADLEIGAALNIWLNDYQTQSKLMECHKDCHNPSPSPKYESKVCTIQKNLDLEWLYSAVPLWFKLKT